MLSATCVVHVDEVLDLVSILVCNYSLFNMTNIHCIGQHFNSFVEKNLSCFLCDKVLQYKFYIDAFLKKIHVCPIYITLLVVSVHKKYQFGNC